jgi:predicted nucleotidyltransferase
MDIVARCREILLWDQDIGFAYIFGSYAHGNLRADSDIDSAIYLEKKMEPGVYLERKVSLTEARKREVDLGIVNEAPPRKKISDL